MRNEVRFLVHVWRDGVAGDAWRARVEELASRKVRLFASLDELHRYLDRELTQRTGRDTTHRQEDA